MSSLADDLLALGYHELFQRMSTAAMDTLWAESHEALEALIMDSSSSNQARFLAAEICFHKTPGFAATASREVLAEIYAQALETSATGNPWALPGFYTGESGQHLLQIGDPAAEALLPLLQIERQLAYEGSEEATVGSKYGFRVKDLAAFFIARLRGIPYTAHRERAMRDAFIRKLEE